MDIVKIRFHLDPETGEPHIYNHGVSEEEVEEVFYSKKRDDRRGSEGSRILTG